MLFKEKYATSKKTYLRYTHSEPHEEPWASSRQRSSLGVHPEPYPLDTQVMRQGVHSPAAPVPGPPPPSQPPHDLGKCHFADILNGSPHPFQLPELVFSSCTGSKATAKPPQLQWLRRESVPWRPQALSCDCQPCPSPSTVTGIPLTLCQSPESRPCSSRVPSPPLPGQGQAMEEHTSCCHTCPAVMGNNQPPTIANTAAPAALGTKGQTLMPIPCAPPVGCFFLVQRGCSRNRVTVFKPICPPLCSHK